MKEKETEEIKRVLRNGIPAMRETELERDLWPAMLQRLEQGTIRVPWWDWVLLGGIAAAVLLMPGILPALLYHL